MAERKTLRDLEIKNEDRGEVAAVFSTFNVIDHDGDVTVPGAFTDGQKVRISAYNHGSWGSALPVGKGTIRSTDREAILDGRFFMDTTSGRETFQVVKELDDLGEWSYGFDIVDSEPGDFDGQRVRYLRRLDVHEVSPVLLGAGIGTRTLAAKSTAALVASIRDGLDSPAKVREVVDGLRGDMKLVEHIGAVKTDVDALADRVRDVVTLRADQGKQLGDASQQALDELESTYKTLREVVTNAAEPSEDSPGLDLDVALELERSRFRLT